MNGRTLVAALIAVGLASGCTASPVKSDPSGTPSGTPSASPSLTPVQTIAAAYKATVKARTANIFVDAEGYDSPRGEGKVDFQSHLLEVTESTADGKSTGRVIDNVKYVTTPSEFKDLTSKPWVRLDLGKLVTAKQRGFDIDWLTRPDVLCALDLLAGANAATFKKMVAGESTYEVTVDLPSALSATPSAQVKAHISGIQQVLRSARLTMSVQLDVQHRVNAIEYRIPQVTVGSPAEMTTMTLSYNYFGTTVQIVAPPAAQTFDLTPIAVIGSLKN
jgi:hypothetical protein